MFQKRVLVVENEPLLRDLIARMLEQEGFAVSTAENAVEAKHAVDETDPDALVLDIELGPGPSGFDLASVVMQENPARGIVFLTNLPDPRFVENSLASTDRFAYLRKSEMMTASPLVAALDAVMRDQIGAEFRHDLLDRRPLAQLTSTQVEILQLVASGKSNAQIAQLRGTGLRAVETVISRVFARLGIDLASEGNPRVEAARLYFLATNRAE